MHNTYDKLIELQQRQIEHLKDSLYESSKKNELLEIEKFELESIIKSQKKIHTDELAKKAIEKFKLEQELEKANRKINKTKYVIRLLDY